MRQKFPTCLHHMQNNYNFKLFCMRRSHRQKSKSNEKKNYKLHAANLSRMQNITFEERKNSACEQVSPP